MLLEEYAFVGYVLIDDPEAFAIYGYDKTRADLAERLQVDELIRVRKASGGVAVCCGEVGGPVGFGGIGQGCWRHPVSSCYYLREYSCGILSGMSVPLTLLGLLERGPSHGYDLKRDYDTYFGQGRPLRYSQVYATLSRLTRDGKTVAGPVEQEAGPERRRYIITEDGVAEVDKWLGEPVPPDPDLQSELFTKVVLALMLGKRADSYLDTQRAAHLRRMRELTSFKQRGGTLDVLLADHALYRLEADLRWIDHTAARLDQLARAVRS